MEQERLLEFASAEGQVNKMRGNLSTFTRNLLYLRNLSDIHLCFVMPIFSFYSKSLKNELTFAHKIFPFYSLFL